MRPLPTLLLCLGAANHARASRGGRLKAEGQQLTYDGTPVFFSGANQPWLHYGSDFGPPLPPPSIPPVPAGGGFHVYCGMHRAPRGGGLHWQLPGPVAQVACCSLQSQPGAPAD